MPFAILIAHPQSRGWAPLHQAHGGADAGLAADERRRAQWQWCGSARYTGRRGTTTAEAGSTAYGQELTLAAPDSTC